MKNLLVLLFIFLLSCEKAEEPKNYDGIYHGTLEYNIGTQDVFIPTATRTIKSNISVWWVNPSCGSTFYPESNTYSIDAMLIDSTECSGVMMKWRFNWKGKGIIKEDSLIERGKVVYEYYSDDVLIMEETGDWVGMFLKNH